MSGRIIEARERRRARAALFAAAVAAVLSASTRSAAPAEPKAQQAREYEVKAAFLYKLAHFVDWPEGVFQRADDPIMLAVAGDDPFGAVLEQTIAGQTAHGRRFEVRRFRLPSQLEACQILFVGASEDHQAWLDALSRRQPAGVLTVGESRAFARRGAFAFLIDGRRIRLAVNLGSVGAARLRVSSQLLALATLVDGDGGDD